MCRHITRDQQIEGWRAAIELLPKLRPGVLGVMAAALMARLHRGIYAAVGRRAELFPPGPSDIRRPRGAAGRADSAGSTYPAVDVDHLIGHVRRAGTGQELDHGGDHSEH